MKIAFLLFLFAIAPMAQARLIPIPGKDIDALLRMNKKQLSEFYVKKNIDVYKFVDPMDSESKDIPQDYLSSLKLVERWRFDQYRDLFDGNVLGFYFSRHNSTVNIDQDTIVLSDKADRWTIAHETAHALIDQKRAENQKRNEQEALEKLINAKEDYEESMSLYRNFGFFLTEDRMIRAFDSIKVWTTLMVEFIDNYELEEVRIENHLKSLYETQPELKLDSHTYKRSFWYAERNCAAAVAKFENAREVVIYFSSLLNNQQKELMKERIKEQMDFLNKYQGPIQTHCPVSKKKS